MKKPSTFRPTVMDQELESRLVLSQAGAGTAAAAYVAHLGLAGGAEAAAMKPETRVHFDKTTQASTVDQKLAYWEARDQVVLGRLVSAGNAIITAAVSPGSRSVREVLNPSFWTKVNRLDRLQSNISSTIYNLYPLQVIQDPIVSFATYHNALETLIRDNGAWFSRHPSSQRVALGLKYQGNYIGSYTASWTGPSAVNADTNYASSGTISLRITSFVPSKADPSVGAIQGTISIDGPQLYSEYENQSLSGNVTATGFEMSGTFLFHYTHFGPTLKIPVTIKGGASKSILGPFELKVQATDSEFPAIDGKGILGLPAITSPILPHPPGFFPE